VERGIGSKRGATTALATGDRRVRGIAACAVAATLLTTLAACTSGRGDECAGAAGCAPLVPVPTSSLAAHDDGRVSGIEGTLTARTRAGRLCIRLDPAGPGAAVNLVLPAGTRATPLGPLPRSGPAQAVLITDNGLGGIRTGDRVVVTPDHRRSAARPRGCEAGPTVYAGWMIRLPR
jgi:hypothetical protein